MTRTAEFAKIIIPKKDPRETSLSPGKTELFVGKGQKKLVLSDITPISLTMNSQEIQAGSSGVQGCHCSKNNCGTGGSDAICC